MLPNAKKLTGRSDAFQIAANLRANSFSTSNQSNLHGRRMILTGREEDG